ncbi:signal peptide peptidase SppA [Chitinophaga caeni]|uniref:Signal peptide peptidase SppA n=1 Tax=Chitinophaga caeni TaxID=2029983 RepID=A0A291QW10_9BACT|nr:signal peptide peptidase SppA [Chitinophaga caeni]ATL48127.1 signal peptide peptidase SppA [Chitinophaga caeni]
MRSFLKFFFAALLALIVFTIISFFLFAGFLGSLYSIEPTRVASNSVLVVDVSRSYSEQRLIKPFAVLTHEKDEPGLHELTRMIRNAAIDDNIKGIYLKVGGNGNGFGATEEIRNALKDFKQSKKFIYAYAEVMTQQSYYVASVADKIYLNPKGGLEFNGFVMQTFYLKNALAKLEIQPQIFYNGKFKSATEPLRETRMTDANRLQTSVFLGELYGHYLSGIAAARKIDTATLHGYANEAKISSSSDALQYKLIDALYYDDQVQAQIRQSLGLGKYERINYVSAADYLTVYHDFINAGDPAIAVIYAQGDIISGSSKAIGTIASDEYVRMIREARMNSEVKAIVFRVNSGGGSALASEVIWRELTLAKKEKPVIVSMGDYAASGGYYISCMADSIFAEPNTLTGSIGVFTVLPNMQGFFNNKLGVTFDEVKTAQYADLGTVSRPLTETEKKLVQQSVDSIYASFKSRVVEGRKLSSGVVDSIAQGRVWSGTEALKLGLVDKIGGLDDAIASAAKMANIPSYYLLEYPELKDVLSTIVESMSNSHVKESMLKDELGINYPIYKQLKMIQSMTGEPQARLPFDFTIH